MTPAAPSNTIDAAHARVGVVAIGRNEGERFARCLASVIDQKPTVSPIIYVDSGSTDGSIELAQSRGAHVVHLDMSTPFTASRARNAGLAALQSLAPDVPYVMFVDGDCEIAPQWFAAASAALDADNTIAIISGRLREFFPAASLYNRLADLEWNKPVGDAGQCGGNAMMRVAIINQLRGFDEALLAGEEPDLCERVRAKGFIVRRIADEMAKHDLAMTRFSQWWTRQRKGGYGSFDVTLFGPKVSRHIFRKAVLSCLVWGFGFFLALALLIALAWIARGPLWAFLAALGGAGLWLLQALRIASGAQKRGLTTSDALAFGLLTMTSKIAYVRGGLANLVDRLFRRGPATINYKAAAHSQSSSNQRANQGASHAV